MVAEDFKDKKNTEEEKKPQAEQEKPEAEEKKAEVEQERPGAEKHKPEQEAEKSPAEHERRWPEHERRKSELEKLKAKEEEDLEEEEPKVDPVEARKAKNAIQFFKKTFSLIKLYPPENPSVQKSVDLFFTQIDEFINEYEELAIEIGEFSFSYKKELVFQDIEKRKSLPFLFYRDGVRELSFLRDLDREELHDFFETVRHVSDLPPEDTDIVNSIWEKDFVHIRYLSIDEFLDHDIGEPTEEISVADKLGLSEGELKLTPEDKELYKKGLGLGIQDGEEKGAGEFEGKQPSDEVTVATGVQPIKKEEMSEIESMLAESRETSSLDELVVLLFELLFLEEREAEFLDLVNVLDSFHQNFVDDSNFSSALSILSQVQELKKAISSKSEERAKMLDRIPDAAKEQMFIARLIKLYSDGHVEDFDAFFLYLEHLGASAFPVVVKIWEESKFPFSRTKVTNFLKEIAKKDIDALLNLAKGQVLSLSREIINIVAADEKKDVFHFEDFVNNPNKDIRLDVIQILGKYEDEVANKILVKFLSDEEAEVRARAFMNLKYLGDKAPFDFALRLAQQKDFRDRIKLEKKAILNFLASTETTEVINLLRSMLKKRRFFAKYKHIETRLCAISALETMATPEAESVLNEGTKLRNRTMRKACRGALRNIARKQKAEEIAKEEQED
jgi:HEAT repeat protein